MDTYSLHYTPVILICLPETFHLIWKMWQENTMSFPQLWRLFMSGLTTHFFFKASVILLIVLIMSLTINLKDRLFFLHEWNETFTELECFKWQFHCDDRVPFESGISSDTITSPFWNITILHYTPWNSLITPTSPGVCWAITAALLSPVSFIVRVSFLYFQFIDLSRNIYIHIHIFTFDESYFLYCMSWGLAL